MCRIDYCEREDFLDMEADRLAEKATRQELAAFRVILRAATCDPQWPVRMKATELLGDFGARGDLFCLVARCEDPEWVVRASAASSIGNAFPRSALKYVKPMLQDRDPIVRRYAIVALWDALGKAAEPFARESLLVDGDLLARVGYIGVLARCGDHEAQAELMQMAKNDNRSLSGLAESILEELRLTPN